MYKKNKEKFLVSYFDKKHRPLRRQDAEIVYKPNGMVYVFKLECLKIKYQFQLQEWVCFC